MGHRHEEITSISSDSELQSRPNTGNEAHEHVYNNIDEFLDIFNPDDYTAGYQVDQLSIELKRQLLDELLAGSMKEKYIDHPDYWLKTTYAIHYMLNYNNIPPEIITKVAEVAEYSIYNTDVSFLEHNAIRCVEKALRHPEEVSSLDQVHIAASFFDAVEDFPNNPNNAQMLKIIANILSPKESPDPDNAVIYDYYKNKMQELSHKTEALILTQLTNKVSGYSLEYFLDKDLARQMPEAAKRAYISLNELLEDGSYPPDKLVDHLDAIAEYPGCDKLLEIAIKNEEAAKNLLIDLSNNGYSHIDIIKNQPWFKNIRNSAFRTVQEADRRRDTETNTSDTFPIVEIPVKALNFHPDYAVVSGDPDQAAKNAFFASNGLVAFNTTVYKSSQFELDKQKRPIRNLQHTIAEITNQHLHTFSIHFIPHDRTDYIEEYDREATKMGLAAMNNFLEYCRKYHIPDDTSVSGSTNLRMAHIATKAMGFHLQGTMTPEELNQGKESGDDGSVEIYTTVGEIKETLQLGKIGEVSKRYKTKKLIFKELNNEEH
jgi:hypothetical protein